MDFTDTQLYHANLRGATLVGANLDNAVTYGANLHDVQLDLP
ncbi:pentapeptide repeat-containing protein [Trichothermofontia sichuanensis B231]|nr:pentapeptide repeat-containing protein [Trichothermofontia sichuanensis B231]